MRSLWDDDDAREFASDPLASRVYTSRLIGQDSSLVLHGGGNTSVKAKAADLFGDSHDAIWVKGSGWDLSTIEAAGFAPLRLDMVRRMAELPSLSDARMVEMLRAALLDPNAPNPSVEAVLHAVIPFAFVATVANGRYGAGEHDARWNGTDANGTRVASGLYFYRLVANGVELTRKMTLLK